MESWDIYKGRYYQTAPQEMNFQVTTSLRDVHVLTLLSYPLSFHLRDINYDLFKFVPILIFWPFLFPVR